MRRWFNKCIDKRQSYKELGNQVNKVLSALQQQGDKPWVLLFGPQGSGKTSLLKHVFPQPVTRDQKSLDTILPTKSIDWWYNDDFIFIDTAGKYGFANPSEPQAFDYWQQFLSLIRKKSLDSACFIIDAPSLLQSDTENFNALLSRFETHSQLLMKSWSGLRLNILVSQCDHLPGFAEFFNNLSTEDQKHPFGLSFNHHNQDQDIETLFKTQFGKFLESINQRLITRLHYEPNRNRRIKIYDFPLQLDFLKNRLASLVRQLPESDLRLDNIFFCSSQQSDKTLNLLLEKLYSTLHLPVRSETPLIKNQQALFITDMVEKLSQFKRPAKTKVAVVKVRKSAGWRIISYPVALGIILLATLTLHQNYQANLATINRVAAMLATTDEDQLLSRLDTLRAIAQNLDHAQNTKVIGFNVANTLKSKADSAYQHYLQNQFMRYLQAILVNQLELPNNSAVQLLAAI